MRVALCMVALVLVFVLPAQAANNIMIGIDSVPNYLTEFMVPFLYENDVDLECIVNGFTIAAYGDITALFGFNKTFATAGRFAEMPLYFLVRTFPDTSVASDSLLYGGCLIWYPGSTESIPAGPLEKLFSYEVLVTKIAGEDSEGDICIDSARKVWVSGDWMWDDGSGNIDPTFNNGNGAHCITYYDADMLRGDVTNDGKVNISDAVYLISFVFNGGPAPNPYIIGDANCDGKSNVGDAVYLINYVFKNGSPPGDPNRDGIPDC